MKSPALVSKLKGFAAKLSDGVGSAVDNVAGNNVVVDNAKNPASAASMMSRKITSAPTLKPGNATLGNKQKTYGVPGAN